MSIKKNNTRNAKATKRIIVFAVIAIVSTIAVSTFPAPAIQATYTAKETMAAPAQVNDDIELANIAKNNEIVAVEGTKIPEGTSEVEGTKIPEAADETKGSQIAEATDGTKNNNTNQTTAPNQNRIPANNRPNPQTGTERPNENGTENKNNQPGNPPADNNDSTSGNGFTPEKEIQNPASSAPVQLSQAAPYYYNNVLNATEKKLYGLLMDGISNLSGEITLGVNLNKNQIDNAFNALIKDQSQIVWIGNGYTLSTVTTYEGQNAITTYTLKPLYTMSGNQAATAAAKLDSEVNALIGAMNGGMTQFDIELLVHDYLVKKITYNQAAARNPGNHPKAYTAYGALVEGSAVCEGYAKAFQLVLNKVGIQTTLISGKTSGGSHMWNMANIDGSWYHIDVTFDDPNNGDAGTVLRNFFNLSSAEIGRSHAIANRFAFPNANSTGQNYFKVKGLSFDSYNNSAANKLYNEVVRAINNKSSAAQIRIGGSMNSALSVLTNANAANGLNNIKAASQKATGRNLSRFSYSVDANLGVITIFLAA